MSSEWSSDRERFRQVWKKGEQGTAAMMIAEQAGGDCAGGGIEDVTCGRAVALVIG